MKKLELLILVSISITSCFKDVDDKEIKGNVTVNYCHFWDGVKIPGEGSDPFPFTNAKGNKLNISKLRYLISNTTLTNDAGEAFVLNSYNLIDILNGSNISYTSNTVIPNGTYTLSFTFGFNNDDNYQNYPTLNATSWNVPEMLGGGYHFMQLEGEFLDNAGNAMGYAYHTIRALDTSKNPLEFQDTFFEVILGKVDVNDASTFNIAMDVDEWFKTPNTWDLNTLNSGLMSNFDAQIKMSENGKDAFRLVNL